MLNTTELAYQEGIKILNININYEGIDIKISETSNGFAYSFIFAFQHYSSHYTYKINAIDAAKAKIDKLKFQFKGEL